MPAASGAKPQPPPPTVSPAAAEMPSTAEEVPFAGQLSNTPAMDGSEPRCSLVLDRHGKRRIHPEQLEHGAGSNQQFVCQLCSFVMTDPIMTSCSHLFCKHCFSVWVAEQVSKQKSRQSAEQKAVTTLPCPYP